MRGFQSSLEYGRPSHLHLGQVGNEMYGMINEAIRTLVTREAGEEVWNQVLESSGVGDDVFEGMEGYDDSVTYSLAEVKSEIDRCKADVVSIQAEQAELEQLETDLKAL